MFGNWEIRAGIGRWGLGLGLGAEAGGLGGWEPSTVSWQLRLVAEFGELAAEHWELGAGI